MAQHLSHKLVLAAVAALLLISAVPGWASYAPVYVPNPDSMNLYASRLEPGSLMLLGAGIVGVIATLRRKLGASPVLPYAPKTFLAATYRGCDIQRHRS
jgi:PEP-CTERM motif